MAGVFESMKDKYKKSGTLGKAGMIGLGAAGTLATGGLLPAALGVENGVSTWNKNQSKRPGWNRKHALRADMQRMQNPEELGLSEDERQRMMEEQMVQSNIQQQAAQNDLARTALSGQSFQDGTFADAAQGIAGQSQQAAASAASSIEQRNQTKISQEADRIRGDMARQEEINKENTKYWSNVGINLAATIATMGAGAPGLISAAGTGPMTQAKKTAQDTGAAPTAPAEDAGRYSKTPEQLQAEANDEFDKKYGLGY